MVTGYDIHELLIMKLHLKDMIILAGLFRGNTLTLMEPAFFWDSQNRGGVDINPPPAISVLGHLGDWC